MRKRQQDGERHNSTHSCSSRFLPLLARSTTPTSLPNTMDAV